MSNDNIKVFAIFQGYDYDGDNIMCCHLNKENAIKCVEKMVAEREKLITSYAKFKRDEDVWSANNTRFFITEMEIEE